FVSNFGGLYFAGSTRFTSTMVYLARVDLEVDHVARMQVLAEVGAFDLEHHLHRAHEALDGVTVEGQPACPRSDRLDHAVTSENPRGRRLLRSGRAGRQSDGRQRQNEPPRQPH